MIEPVNASIKGLVETVSVGRSLLVAGVWVFALYLSSCADPEEATKDAVTVGDTVVAGDTVATTDVDDTAEPEAEVESTDIATEVAVEDDLGTIIPCAQDSDCKVPYPSNETCVRARCDTETGTGRCVVVAVEEGEACNDGDLCTHNLTCTDGKCVGDAISCDDDQLCTEDSCEPESGCLNSPIVDNGEDEICDGIDNNCNGVVDDFFGDTDKDGIADCVDEDDDNDEVVDNMDNCPTAANTDQADLDDDKHGDACDEDIDDDGSLNEDDCEPKAKTAYPGADEICGDGLDNDCNGETDSGVTPLCDDQDDCTDDVCDPSTGTCAHPPSEVCLCKGDEDCANGNLCDGVEKCVNGDCLPNPKSATDCDDDNKCTDDVCNPDTGKCNHSVGLRNAEHIIGTYGMDSEDKHKSYTVG